MNISEYAHHLIEVGIERRAQDLYLLPKETRLEIAIRIGHTKIVLDELSPAEGEKLILHYKFVGEMDVSERRKPQLGAATYMVQGIPRRLRLSTVGNFRQQESLVIRFLHQFAEDQANYFFPRQVQTIQRLSERRGLFLFCGPVSSGKTTLMYQLAKRLDAAKQVISIEDPVEIEEQRFLQLQINEKIGVTYDELIKLSLRHHPDILIIGEIRDTVTAQAAVRAALTGHTVYATLHTRSAKGALSRLQELNVSLQDVTECLQGIIYQRLLVTTTGQQGVLLDQRYGGNWDETTDWQTNLRKLWAYGFIDRQVWDQEQASES